MCRSSSNSEMVASRKSTLEEVLDIETSMSRSQWVLNPPDPPSMLRQVLDNVKDILLPHPQADTFSSLRNQPFTKRAFAFFQNLFPILASFQNYSAQKLKCDFMAGLTLAIFAVPQCMGNATLAQLSPEYGLYTGIVPPLIYALLASSRETVIGPGSVDSLLLSSMIQTLKVPIDSIGYTRLVFTVTFFAGIFQVAFGLFRFGFLVEYISQSTIVGFLAAAAVGIGLQQLKGLFGIVKFTNKTALFSVVKSLWTSFRNQSAWHPYNFVIGCSFLCFILFIRFLGKRNKKLIWLSHVAPLLSIIISSIIAYKINVDEAHVKDYIVEVLGPIKGGGSLNPSSFNQLIFDTKVVGHLIRIGFTIAIISITGSIAVGRSFASLKGHSIDPNREVVSLGIMNIVGSLTSCYIASGSLSRTAVNYNAGSETMVSNIVMALTVLLSLKFLTGLLYFTPKAILAAIILSAVPGLIDLKKASEIWKVDKMDFLACAGAFFGVLFASAEIGLAVGITVSFARIIVTSIQPAIAVIGRLPGTDSFGDVQQYPMALNTPGVFIVSLKSAWLCFANANLVEERIERWMSDEKAYKHGIPGQNNFHHLIIDASSLTNIDTTGIACLVELNKSMASRGIKLAIANPRWHVIHKLRLANFVSKIGGRVFLSVVEAVDACVATKMVAV